MIGFKPAELDWLEQLEALNELVLVVKYQDLDAEEENINIIT